MHTNLGLACVHHFHITNTTLKYESRAKDFTWGAQELHYMKVFSQEKLLSSNLIQQN